jgi:2-dehydro-3-deoxy-D-arabinonate dehydratase
MRLTQLRTADGALHAAIIDSNTVVDIASDEAQTVVDYIALARRQGKSLAEVAGAAQVRAEGRQYALSELEQGSAAGGIRLAIPISPPEVWGCGVTYKKSAEFRDEDTSGSTKGIYDYVYSAPRPEIFFKATAARCVGPDEPIVVRSDSSFTAPEPELALVLNAGGEIVGFTVADDVSAWDIERENPLYLPQSKVYAGCCSLGPVIVTPDEIGDANNLLLECRIIRGSDTIFSGEVNTSRIGRTFAELIEYLTRDNPVPDGTVVCTGTGVIAEREHALQDGDRVEIDIEKIGSLRNPVRQAG